MRGNPGRAALPAALVALWAGLSWAADAGAVPWWNDAWACRRTVVVSCAGDRGPGQPVAWVRFRTHARIRPDGKDVRVVCDGQVRPHRVIFVGPGDLCLVAFQAKPAKPTYHIYFDNPKAKAPDADWSPQRGLLLETRQYGGGHCKNWQTMQQLLKRSRPAMGMGFAEKIFHGFNPFGPTEKYVSVFRGWLNCPTTCGTLCPTPPEPLKDPPEARNAPPWSASRKR